MGKKKNNNNLYHTPTRLHQLLFSLVSSSIGKDLLTPPLAIKSMVRGGYLADWRETIVFIHLEIPTRKGITSKFEVKVLV